MAETWQTQRGLFELLSMVVIITGVPVAGESTALQVFWLIVLIVGGFLVWRGLRHGRFAPQ